MSFFDLIRRRKPEPARVLDEHTRRQVLRTVSQNVGRKLLKRVLDQTDSINAQFNRAAKRNGLDPRYVQSVLNGPSQNWPSAISSKQKKALHMAKRALQQAERIQSYPTFDPGSVGDDAALVKVFKEVAKWIVGTVVGRLDDAYLSIVMKEAQSHLNTLRREDDPDEPLVDVSSQISGYFKNVALRRETASWRHLLLQVVDLIDN